MEKFNQLLSELKKIDLPSDQFVIFGSGCLAVRGIRDVADLDVVASPILWRELAQKYSVITDEQGIERINLGPDIEALGPGSVVDKLFNRNELIDAADIFDGLRYINLQDFIKFKKYLHREKDIKDLALLDQYLSSDKSRS